MTAEPVGKDVSSRIVRHDVNPAQGWTAEDNVAASPGNFLDWRQQSRVIP